MSRDTWWVRDLDHDIYLSGSWLPEPSLSCSGARRLLRTSPAQWRWEQDHPAPATRAMDFGTLAHERVLGTAARVDVVPEDLLSDDGGVRSKAAREWVAEHEAAHIPWIKPEQAAIIEMMVSQLRAHDVTLELLTHPNAQTEVSIAIRDTATKVLMRGRCDVITTHEGRPTIVDYKTTADIDSFAAAVRRYDYQMQDSWYRRIVDAITGETHDFLFVVQSKTPPYLVSVIRLDAISRSYGDDDGRAALALFAHYSNAGEWPAYHGVTDLILDGDTRL